jgi:hypothetical protein
MSLSKPATRKDTTAWLIGCCSSSDATLPQYGKLPTTREVLKCILAKNRATPGTANSEYAARETMKALMSIWACANIPTQDFDNASKRLHGLYEHYRALMKVKHRKGDLYEKRRQDFVTKLDRTYDIGHKDALSVMTVEEDRLFYTDMLTERKGYMAGIDLHWCREQAEKEERLAKRLKRKSDEAEGRAKMVERDFRDKQALTALVSVDLSESENSTDDEADKGKKSFGSNKTHGLL